MSLFAKLDESLQHTLGIPYLCATRDNSIHDRLSYLVNLVSELPGAPLRVIDVGCGSGMALCYLAQYAGQRTAQYVGIDRSIARLTHRYAGCRLPHDFFDVDLDDNWNFGEFDLAWCAEVLEHLIDDRGVFARICRSVRRGGYIAVTMPSRTHLERVGITYPSLLEIAHEQNGGHVRVGYTESELAALCSGTAARLIRVDAVTRSDLSYVRRRYIWPGTMQLLNNIWNSTARSAKDRFAMAGKTPFSLDDFLSIVGLYQIG